MTTLREALSALGHTLPEASAPVANYVSFVREGNLLSISGQVSRRPDGSMITGTLGADVSEEEGRAAAELCALGVLAQLAAATDGTVGAVKRVMRLGVFVASTPDFTRQPQVANGASDLIAGVFGEAGRHSRAAVGVSALPGGAAVEVDALIVLADG